MIANDEPSYRCIDCYDRGVKLTERVRADGSPLGTFGSPCHCSMGEETRRAWLVPNMHTHRILADSAMDVTERLRQLEARQSPVQAKTESDQKRKRVLAANIPKASPDDTFGQMSVKAMKRIGQIGPKAWVAEEIATPSSSDPVWTRMVGDMAQRWG